MKITDLFIDSKDGKLSHTKLWSNFGLLAMTVVFVYRGLFGEIESMEMEYLMFGLIVVSPQLLSKFLNLRFGTSSNTPPDSNNKEE